MEGIDICGHSVIIRAVMKPTILLYDYERDKDLKEGDVKLILKDGTTKIVKKGGKKCLLPFANALTRVV